MPDPEIPDETDLHFPIFEENPTTAACNECFWKPGMKEYFCTLYTRKKWTQEENYLKLKSVVSREDNSPPHDLPFNRIFAENDNIPRVVEIRAHKGSYTHPVVRLPLFLPASNAKKKPESDVKWKPQRENQRTSKSEDEKILRIGQRVPLKTLPSTTRIEDHSAYFGQFIIRPEGTFSIYLGLAQLRTISTNGSNKASFWTATRIA